MSAKSELYQLIELVEQKAEHTPRASIDIPDLIAAQKQLKQFLVTFLAITLINRNCFITLQKSLTARQTVTPNSTRRSSSIRAPFRLSSAMSSARGSTTMECEVSWESFLKDLEITFHPIAILVLYMTRKLLFDDDTATIIYHGFTTLVYFCCVVGAIIADSWWGKFHTILWLSMVYVCGSTVITIGAIEPWNMPATWVWLE